MILTTKNGL